MSVADALFARDEGDVVYDCTGGNHEHAADTVDTGMIGV
jgi:hypothetical protein